MNNEPPNPEPTPAEKFRAFAQRVVSVPKAVIDQREAEYQKQRAAKKQQKRAA